MSDDGLKDLVYMICFSDSLPNVKDRELVKVIGKNIDLHQACLDRGWDMQYVHNYVDLFESDIGRLSNEVHQDIDEQVFVYIIENYDPNYMDVVTAMLANSQAPISKETFGKLIDLITVEPCDMDNIEAIIENRFSIENIPKLTELAERFWNEGAVEPKYYWFFCYAANNIDSFLQLGVKAVTEILGAGAKTHNLYSSPVYEAFFSRVLDAAPLVAQKLSGKKLSPRLDALVRQKLVLQ